MQRGTRKTNRRAVYEDLRRRILALELQPGATLSENELAAELGVSRTPVRESLILLADEGLVQVFPKVGSFVSRVDPQRVADAQFLREAVELASLKDLPPAGELDEDVLASLRANLEQQQAPDVEREAFFQLDEAFHHGLLQLSGHAGAWPSVSTAKGHLDRARRLGLQRVRPLDTMAAQHLAVLEAVSRGDADGAVLTMRTHLQTIFEDIERIRTRSPELFATDGDSTPVRRSIAVWR
ncbi:MAG: GntR family transcriptional regulator, rspAB operon transcriptional repressor [Actinomycetota bacterium]|nr:GntR family transcriptional regulator, rspAB operon transcriptional repressor [Actinomycetota bacterium]